MPKYTNSYGDVLVVFQINTAVANFPPSYSDGNYAKTGLHLSHAAGAYGGCYSNNIQKR